MLASVKQAVEIVGRGGVIAYPTEAVFGLGCDPLNQAAVERLLAIKQRPQSKGLILLAASTQQLKSWIVASPQQWQQMNARWPAAVTFLVTPTPKVPAWIKGGHDTVAVRVSAHPLARQLALATNTPIVSTSANRSGQPAHRHAAELVVDLGTELDAVVDGACNISDRPSTIIDLESGKILRK